MEAEVDNIDVFNVKYMTGRSIDDALEESISGEVFLFIVTCEDTEGWFVDWLVGLIGWSVRRLVGWFVGWRWVPRLGA